jgi:hypothetical protein
MLRPPLLLPHPALMLTGFGGVVHGFCPDSLRSRSMVFEFLFSDFVDHREQNGFLQIGLGLQTVKKVSH